MLQRTSHSLFAAMREIADVYLGRDRSGELPLALNDPFVLTQVEHKLANREYSLAIFDPLLADVELSLLPVFSHHITTLQEERGSTPVLMFSPRITHV